MFPSSTTIQVLELRVNELSEIIENQNDELEALRNKITALEAIIQEDAKITNDAADWLDNYILNDA